MSKKPNYFSIGLFIILGFGLATIGVVVFGSGLIQKDTFPFVLTFKQSVNGLRPGSNVKVNGIVVGSVREIYLNTGEDFENIFAPCIIDLDLDKLGYSAGTKFTRRFIQADFENNINRGLYAQLKTESFVTGMLYVEFGYREGLNTFVLKDERFDEYLHIPTVSTDYEELKGHGQRLLENLGKTDFAGLVEEVKTAANIVGTKMEALDTKAMNEDLLAITSELRQAVEREGFSEGVDELLKAFGSLASLLEEWDGSSGSIAEGLDSTLSSLSRTLANADAALLDVAAMMDTHSPLQGRSISALEDISDAARAMRELMEYLQRNPNALITGKKSKSDNE